MNLLKFNIILFILVPIIASTGTLAVMTFAVVVVILFLKKTLFFLSEIIRKQLQEIKMLSYVHVLC